MATYDGQAYALFCNRWSGAEVEPAGYRYLESFRLEGTTPVRSYALQYALLEKWDGARDKHHLRAA